MKLIKTKSALAYKAGAKYVETFWHTEVWSPKKKINKNDILGLFNTQKCQKKIQDAPEIMQDHTHEETEVTTTNIMKTGLQTIQCHVFASFFSFTSRTKKMDISI